jgi:hypothetical protein
MVGQDTTCARQQPRQRLLWNIVQPPACDYEDLHHYVIRDVAVGATAHVGVNFIRVARIELLKSSALLAVHNNIMSSNTTIFTAA